MIVTVFVSLHLVAAKCIKTNRSWQKSAPPHQQAHYAALWSLHILSLQAGSKTMWFVSLNKQVVQQCVCVHAPSGGCAALSGDSDHWVLIICSLKGQYINAQGIPEHLCSTLNQKWGSSGWFWPTRLCTSLEKSQRKSHTSSHPTVSNK